MKELIVITLNIKKLLLTSENSGDSNNNIIDNCCEIRIIMTTKITIMIVQEYISYNKMNKYNNN